MAILIAIIFLAGFLAAVLYEIGLNGIGAIFFTVLASCAAFYFWFMHEVSISTNAYGLAAWPALLLIYLLIVIVAGALGIWLVKKSKSPGNKP